MRNGGHVLDHRYFKTCGLQSADRSFSARAGALDEYFDGLQTMLHSCLCGSLSCGMRIEAAYGVLIAVACFAGAPFIMKLFVTDPEVVHLGVRFLRTVSLFYLMPAATNGIQGFFRGIGDLKVTLVSSTFNMVFRVAAAAVFVLVWKMEIEALPYSYAVGWVVMLLYELPMLVRYLRSHGDEL